MTNGIDIVIPWVDGSDPEWQAAFRAEKAKKGGAESESRAVMSAASTPADDSENTSVIRYRDWGTLQYIFRGIEKFAPWVGRVHLVTWGHLPEWLDERNPRLDVVRHNDYIPTEYLPTFSSNPIELNFHRIEGLAERFILFNDDMFFTRSVPEERFFKDGQPCDMARLSLIAPSSISHSVLCMVEILNRRHDRRAAMRHNPDKWYSPKYGLGNIVKTLDLSLWSNFSGLFDSHMPQPHLKSTFEKMWAEERAVLDDTCRRKFRSPFDVNHWLMRYEQLAMGRFLPVSFRDVRLDTLHEERIGEIEQYISQQRYAMICLNDSLQLHDFDCVASRLRAAFETILPEKSSFER